jgi:predicted phosphodiesterase
MDSGEDKDDSNKEYGGLADFARYCKQQQQWLEKEIQSEAFKNAAFRVVLIHIPIDVGPKVELSDRFTAAVGALFEKGKVDVMICGHTHQPK